MTWMPNKTQKELLKIAKKTPHRIISNEDDLFFRFCKEFVHIRSDISGRAQIIPFVPFPEQRKFLSQYCKQRADGRPNRQVNLKCRQCGQSTLSMIIHCIEMLLFQNLSAVIASERKLGSAKNIFKMYKRFFVYLPWNLSLIHI